MHRTTSEQSVACHRGGITSYGSHVAYIRQLLRNGVHMHHFGQASISARFSALSRSASETIRPNSV
jgi:hypothetical protein